MAGIKVLGGLGFFADFSRDSMSLSIVKAYRDEAVCPRMTDLSLPPSLIPPGY
jgi:hypothetical protein